MTGETEQSHDDRLGLPSIPSVVWFSNAHKSSNRYFENTTSCTSLHCSPTKISTFLCLSQWDSWRRRLAITTNQDDGFASCAEGDEEEDPLDNGIGGQDDRYHRGESSHRDQDQQDDYSEDEEPSHPSQTHKQTSARSVSDLSESQGSSSQSSARRRSFSSGGSQSSGRGRVSTSGQNRKKKRHSSQSQPVPPKLPGQPLANSVYRSKEERRREHLQDDNDNQSISSDYSDDNMSKRQSKKLVDDMRPEERAIHYKEMFEEQQRENAKLKQQAQTTNTGSKKGGGKPAAKGGGRRKSAPTARADSDDEDYNEEGMVARAVAGEGSLVVVDVGDTTKGSQDMAAMVQTFKKHVWRSKKWINSRSEQAVAALVLDHMKKKGFMLTGDREKDSGK